MYDSDLVSKIFESNGKKEELYNILSVDNKFSTEDVNKLADSILEVFQISEEKIIHRLLNHSFFAEFDENICNFNNANNSSVSLIIKNNDVNVEFMGNKVYRTDNLISFYSDVVYIDDPFVLDSMTNNVRLRYKYATFNHTGRLRHQIIQKSTNNVVREIISNDKLDNVYNKINSVCMGELEHNMSSLKYRFNDKSLSMENLSTGLKTFVILKTLLINGVIGNNSTIILDEPEIHLHPEWQILLAEIIVLLQIEFDLNILLNTHSPYFLEAIEVYSKKYSIGDKCKYYIAENVDNDSIIKDVTDSTEIIYKKLARPFQILENERYSND